MGQVVYQSIEKVVIIKELELDYVVEDLATSRQYLVDKSYFRKRYESIGEIIAQGAK